LDSVGFGAAGIPPSEPEPLRSARASGYRPTRPVNAERASLALALLISLLMHALLLSLLFGGHGLGFPGFGLPWRERRIEAPDLRIVLVPARVPAAESAGTARLPATPAVPPAQTPARTPRAEPMAPAKPGRDGATSAAAAKTSPRAEGSGDAAPTPIPEPAVTAVERPDDARQVVPAVPLVPTPIVAADASVPGPRTVMPAPSDVGEAAQERTDPLAQDRATELARLDRLEREARLEAARIETAREDAARKEAERIDTVRLEAEREEAARQTAARQEEAARQEAQRAARLEAERLEAARHDAVREEARRVETMRREAERQEAAQQEASRQEVQRVEAARQEAERQEARRQEAARQEAARQEAARQEAARHEAARHDAARQDVQRADYARQQAEREELARQEAQREEAARREAERQEAARAAAARQEAARAEAAQDEARREARLRAIGRQLDEEAARREAASTAAVAPSRLAPSSSGARRGRLFGRTDPNAELILYAEAWARKIQLNMTFDMVRDAAKQPHTNPLVTVAIRSDGSVESVTFVLSSGVAEIDEAIRRIVQSQLPYQAFPPGLAREFDVIEIRRTWHFDTAIRLY
jgi:hypothetical protein